VRKRDSQNATREFIPMRRDVIAAAVIALLAGVAVALPASDVLRGLSIDALTALRWRAFGQQSDPNSSPVVVVALDEESFHTPPFEGTPTIAWTREVGRVLTAIIDGGAKVVGFDVVFATSIEQSAIPVGEETLGARLRGFDRDFLRALALAARDGKVVLGEIQHREDPILPAAGQRVAVGQQRNIRALNVYDDADEVVRRIPLSFMVDGVRVPSMAVELAARALGSPPRIWIRRKRDGCRPPHSRQRPQYDDAQFRRRRRRYSDFFAGRSQCLRGQGGPGVFPA